MNISALMRMVGQEYHFHVYHAVAMEEGYQLDTNCGPKYISIWHNEDHLRWAFSWREALAQENTHHQHGFIQLDRFIRTRRGAPYVSFNHKYVVVQDMRIGEAPSLDQALDWYWLGRRTGRVYDVCRKMSTQRNDDHSARMWTSRYELQNKQFLNIRKRINGMDSFFSCLVESHWKLIKKRWDRGSTLLIRSRQDNSAGWFLPEVKVEQWKVLKQGCLYFRSTAQTPVDDLQSIASLLQDVCLNSEQSVNHLDPFYTGFDEEFQPSLADWYNILAYLVLPQSFVRIIRCYIEQGYSDEECVQLWLDQCYRQEKVDELQLWLADRIDRKRQEYVI